MAGVATQASFTIGGREPLGESSVTGEAAEIFRRTTDLLSQGRASDALAILTTAIVDHPDHKGVACRFADCLHALERFQEARDAYRRALALDPGNFDAWYGLGCAEIACGAYGAAISSLERATALQPTRIDAKFNLGKALFETGEIDRALEQFAAAAKADDAPLREQASDAIAVVIPGSPRADNADILATRRRHAQRAGTSGTRVKTSASTSPPPGSKLRIGYLSAFFGSRNWMKPVWALINHHDRSAFEIHLLSDGKDPSEESGYRDYPGDYVHAIRGVSNERLASLIATLGIDVLVDLNAYSFTPRLGVFAYRPAPVALGWFNTFATTGLPRMDYVIGDAAVIPSAEEAFYSERVLRVSGTYLAFSVEYPVPPVSPPPSAKGDRFVFGCLGSQYKVTDEVIGAWADILRPSPHSVLLIRNGHLGEVSNREALHRRFAKNGVSPERVLLEGPAEHFAFLETYSRIDVALDTFPYNGGTTTMEALWQGVPVLTFNGDRWASRTSRSLLLAAGLEDWVMPSREAYIERAVALASASTTPAQLTELRAIMRGKLSASPACDGAALCRDMERIYREVRGTPP